MCLNEYYLTKYTFQYIPSKGVLAEVGSMRLKHVAWHRTYIFFFPLALQPQFGPWPTSMKLSVSLRFSRSSTFGGTPWAGDQLVARPLHVHKHRKTRARTRTHTHTHTNIKHTCPEWDSNPRSRLPSERRQCMPFRPLGYRDRQVAHYPYGNICMQCMFPKSVIGLKLTNKYMLQFLRAFSLNKGWYFKVQVLSNYMLEQSDETALTSTLLSGFENIS
jgi:hypothetical protein